MSISPSSSVSKLSLYSCTAAASAEAGMSLREVVPWHADYNMSKIIVSQASITEQRKKYFTAHSCTNVPKPFDNTVVTAIISKTCQRISVWKVDSQYSSVKKEAAILILVSHSSCKKKRIRTAVKKSAMAGKGMPWDWNGGWERERECE